MKTPTTVSNRYETLIKRLNPTLTNTEVKSISDKTWYVQNFFASAPLKEDINIAEEYDIAMELAKVDGDVVGYCNQLKPKRTLSAETRTKRIKDKILKLSAEYGLNVEFKGGNE